MSALIIFLFVGQVGQAIHAPGAEIREAREAPGHYCGILCVYGAAQVLGVDFEFERIVAPRFVSGKRGSTVNDLTSALEHVGIPGRPVGFLTIETLRSISQPVILHVRTPCGGTEYTHWVLFLGFDKNGRIRMYDPPRESGSVTPGELLSMWDGVGIVVGGAPLGAARPWAAGPALPLVGLVAVVCTVLALTLRWLGAWSAIGAATLAAILLPHLIWPTGFLRSPQAVANVQTSFFGARGQEAEPIDFAEMSRLMGSGQCQAVDARRRSSFDRFRIPGAVNIPIDSGYLRLARDAKALEQQRVVVYCQSDRCLWAEKIAVQLMARGVNNVCVYKGGVREWHAKQGK